MTKVILKGYIIVPAENLIAVQNELPLHIEKTRQEEGCLVFDISQDDENKFKFNVHEEFVDRIAFSAHQDRMSNSKWSAASVNIERHFHINTLE